MKKEQFIALGIDAKIAEKAEEESKKELAEYIAKATYDEVVEEKKRLEKDLSDRDAQLETMKKSVGDNEELKKQITDLQDQNKKQAAEHKQAMDDMKMSNAIRQAIGSSAQDADLVAGLIDRKKLILGDDGKVTGLDEQLKTLKESKKFLFKPEDDNQQQNPPSGFRVGVTPDQQKQGEQSFSLFDAVAEAIGK